MTENKYFKAGVLFFGLISIISAKAALSSPDFFRLPFLQSSEWLSDHKVKFQNNGNQLQDEYSVMTTGEAFCIRHIESESMGCQRIMVRILTSNLVGDLLFWQTAENAVILRVELSGSNNFLKMETEYSLPDMGQPSMGYGEGSKLLCPPVFFKQGEVLSAVLCVKDSMYLINILEDGSIEKTLILDKLTDTGLSMAGSNERFRMAPKVVFASNPYLVFYNKRNGTKKFDMHVYDIKFKKMLLSLPEYMGYSVDFSFFQDRLVEKSFVALAPEKSNVEVYDLQIGQMVAELSEIEPPSPNFAVQGIGTYYDANQVPHLAACKSSSSGVNRIILFDLEKYRQIQVLRDAPSCTFNSQLYTFNLNGKPYLHYQAYYNDLIFYDLSNYTSKTITVKHKNSDYSSKFRTYRSHLRLYDNELVIESLIGTPFDAINAGEGTDFYRIPLSFF